MPKTMFLFLLVLGLSACSSKDNSTMGGVTPNAGTPPVQTNPQLPAPGPTPFPQHPTPHPGTGFPGHPGQPNQYDSLTAVGFVSLQIVQEQEHSNTNFSIWTWNTCVRNGQFIKKRFSTQNQSIQNISPLLHVKIDIDLEGKKLNQFQTQKGLVKGLVDFSVRDHHAGTLKQNQLSFMQTENFRKVERLTLPHIPNGYKLIIEYKPFAHNGHYIISNEQLYQQCLDAF
jgi:hypothetical protein